MQKSAPAPEVPLQAPLQSSVYASNYHQDEGELVSSDRETKGGSMFHTKDLKYGRDGKMFPPF